MTIQVEQRNLRSQGLSPSRLTRIARILGPIYLCGLVIAAPFALAVFGYGLAHANAVCCIRPT